ncbi:MAG: glycosyltransferase [Verrucomicrobiota bacterium]|nr:glycosyltransferase [Verrucomicrobiota bacterium]
MNDILDPDRKMIHVLPCTDISSGGLSPAVVHFNHALNRMGVRSEIVGCTGSLVGQGISYAGGTGNPNFGYSSNLSQFLTGKLRSNDIINIHGLWAYPNIVAGRLSRRLKFPLIIHPHGMLEPWGMARGKFKKMLFRFLFEEKTFRQATCWRALTNREADQIRQIVPDAKIIVVPNGVEIGTQDQAERLTALDELWPELCGKKIMLYLSRLHPKKGLNLLAGAWKKLAPLFPDWHLVVAGGGDDGFVSHLKHELFYSCRNICFVGTVEGQKKVKLFQRSDAFVLPSYSEGFSMAVLEAMSFGLPVVITSHCNFPEVQTVGAGFVVSAEETPLQVAMSHLMESTDYKAMGLRGQRFVIDNYSWDVIARKFLKEFESTTRIASQ